MYESPCYCTNLRRSALWVTEYYDKALAPCGLSVPQYYLLINLSRMERANLSQWAERVGLDRTTMVRNVKTLEAKGLVAPAEGRGRTFALTDSGKDTLARGVALWEQAQAGLREKLGVEDAEALLRICRKLQKTEESQKDVL